MNITQETDNGEKQYEYSFRDRKGNSFTEKFNFEEHKDSNELSIQIIKMVNSISSNRSMALMTTHLPLTIEASLMLKAIWD